MATLLVRAMDESLGTHNIEFVAADTQVSGFAITAQVKGTTTGFYGENPAGFRSAAILTRSITGCAAGA